MIVIPMAGFSRRFLDAGYDKPKFMLPLGGSYVFDHAVGSFSRYFSGIPITFVYRSDADVDAFVDQRCTALEVGVFHRVALSRPTAGQAETVILGIDGAGVPDADAVTVFNIDTFRPAMTFPAHPWFVTCAGYLDVFRGSGDNWSFVKQDPAGGNRVMETAEKVPISDLCCTGLYHFSRADAYRDAYQREVVAPTAKELYVAPLYNHLIRQGLDVRYELIDRDAVVFCGVPAEYEELRHNMTVGPTRACPQSEDSQEGS